MKNKNKSIKIVVLVISFIVISVSIIAGVIRIYIRKNVISKNDVIINAIATEDNYIINEKNNEIEKDIKVDISLQKSQKGDLLLYLVIEDTVRMTFDSRDKNNDEFYIPNSIGSDGVSDKLFKDLVDRNEVADIGTELFLKGIPISHNKQEFHLRTYLNKTKDFVGYNNPVIVCVYYKDILGHRYSWTKIVLIEIAK